MLKTAQESFEFVKQELGEVVELPWFCNQSKALDFLTYLKPWNDPDVKPAEMARAIASFHCEQYTGGSPELNAYRKALLKLTREFFPKQHEALSFLQCLAQSISPTEWGNFSDVGCNICSVIEYLEASHSFLEDFKFLHKEIPIYRRGLYRREDI